MTTSRISPVARSVRMTLGFYRAQGRPAQVPLDDAPGRSAASRIFDFSRPGKAAAGEDWLQVRLPDPNFEQPPARLEARNDIRGIAHHYRLPRELAAEEIQAYACIVHRQQLTARITRREADGRMSRLWRVLERLNPPLKALSFDRRDPHKVSDAVWGVASAFNPKDIQFFLAGNTWASANEDAAYAAQIGRLGPKLKEGYVGWVAAPGTLADIWRQVRGRKPEKKTEEPGRKTSKPSGPKAAG